jgi:hypothetical protein
MCCQETLSFDLPPAVIEAIAHYRQMRARKADDAHWDWGDAFLSFSHGPGVASNPPGWARVYADLGRQPLSIGAYKDAIRRSHHGHERPVAHAGGGRPRAGLGPEPLHG